MRENLGNFDTKVKGLSIDKRRVLFNNELGQVAKSPSKLLYNIVLGIVVNRPTILDKLMSMVDQDLTRNLSIEFSGEPGIDAGGLKREFYDLIGALMKNEKYPFFKPVMGRNRTCYTLNPELLKNKKKDIYMKIFGKFIANSILNNYLVGIDFADSFIKTLYDEPIEFSDLKELTPAEEYSRYEYLLKV
jgi:hypothetical protein